MLMVATALSGAFGGLIAYGVLQMDGVSGVAGWRWLFHIEGIMSMLIGICGFFALPSTTEQAWFLNSEEKHVAHLRNLQKAETVDDGTINWDEVREAFASPMCWLSGLIQFGVDVCVYSKFGTSSAKKENTNYRFAQAFQSSCRLSFRAWATLHSRSRLVPSPCATPR